MYDAIFSFIFYNLVHPFPLFKSGTGEEAGFSHSISHSLAPFAL
jgi:hypothetical protein